MSKKTIAYILTSLGVSMALSGTAYAHPGHGGSIVEGLAHPVVGLDHLIAMLAIGIWASQFDRAEKWAIPFSFVTAMGLSAAAAMSGLAFKGVELGISGSLLLAALLIGLRIKPHVVLGSMFAAGFAVFHGMAHGLEIPSFASPWQYFAGFLLSTMFLHGAGLFLGMGLSKYRFGMPAAGALLFAGAGWLVA